MIVLAAVAMVSCGGNTNSQATEEVETVETVVTEQAPADSTACAEACDSTACPKAEGECCTK